MLFFKKVSLQQYHRRGFLLRATAWKICIILSLMQKFKVFEPFAKLIKAVTPAKPVPAQAGSGGQ
jgi:hypothetical protein